MSVLDQLRAAGIEPRRVRDGENRAPCPKCDRGEHDDAVAVLIAADRACWVCHRCQWTGAVSDRSNVDGRQPRPARLPATKSREILDLAQAIWVEAVPLAGTLGQVYLERRACVLPAPSADVRFYPALFCAKVGRILPALVCRVSTVRGNIGVGIHRIFLEPAGSDRAVAKMRLGGSDEPVCIRLFHDEDVVFGLGIAEGVETALAAAHLHSPIWSTIDAGQMARFPVLDGIESLTIFADNDEAGLRAARDCAARWRDAKRRTMAVTAAVPGRDINDVVREAAYA